MLKDVRVDVAWDGSGSWEIVWSGGPTEPSMRLLVDELVTSAAPAFSGVDFLLSRGLPPAAWARGLIAAHRQGRGVELWQLRELLSDREYPERCANAEDARMVDRLISLAGPSEYAMRDLLDHAGLAVLDQPPPDVASLAERRLRRLWPV